jgi:hypothetical protein
MGRRVLLALLSAAVLVGLMAQPDAAVNAPPPVMVSSNPADWTPHVLDGKVAAIVQVGNRIVAGGQFTRVTSAAAPTTAIARSNISAFDATTGAIDPAFAPVLDAQVEALAVAPTGCTCSPAAASPQLVHRQRHDHGLGRPRLRHHDRRPLHR